MYRGGKVGFMRTTSSSRGRRGVDIWTEVCMYRGTAVMPHAHRPLKIFAVLHFVIFHRVHLKLIPHGGTITFAAKTPKGNSCEKARFYLWTRRGWKYHPVRAVFFNTYVLKLSSGRISLIGFDMLLVYSMLMGIGMFTGIGCLVLTSKRVCPLIGVFLKAKMLPCDISLARKKSIKSFVRRIECWKPGHGGPPRRTSCWTNIRVVPGALSCAHSFCFFTISTIFLLVVSC